MDIFEQIKDSLEFAERDIKFQYGDNTDNLNLNFTAAVAYDYLNIDEFPEYSFHHDEFLKATSVDNHGKSDYAIYFDKIKSLCTRSLEESLFESDYTEHINMINPNKQLKSLVKGLFKLPSIPHEQLPQFGEFGLYTNKDGGKAPRIFFFIGNLGVIYILLYDPFHKIIPKKS